MKRLPTATTYIFVTLFTILSGCNYVSLSKEEAKINPYERGDVIVFKSDSGLVDTVFIKSVAVMFPETEIPQSTSRQSLGVQAECTDPNYDRYISTEILEIAAKTDVDSGYISFSVFVGKYNFEHKVNLDNFDSLKTTTLSTPYGELKDVIMLVREKEYSVSDEIIYWSKSKGYVGFTEENGRNWLLLNYYKP